MIKIKRIRDTMTKRTAGYEHTMTRDRHTFEIGEYETGNHIVTLINNHRARNTTYNNVMKFLERDKTDLMVYVPGNFMCADFASTVHNNAEKAGIRCGYARVHYDNCRYTHALNAFYTTDKGLIFTDSTGVEFNDDYQFNECNDVTTDIRKNEMIRGTAIDGTRTFTIDSEEHGVEKTQVFW